MSIREPQASACNGIDVRGSNCRRAVATQITVANIIGIDQDDIGVILCGEQKIGGTGCKKGCPNIAEQTATGELLTHTKDVIGSTCAFRRTKRSRNTSPSSTRRLRP